MTVRIIGFLVIVTAWTGAPLRAWEPTQPITIVVGFPPGGGTDLMARTLAAVSQPHFPVPLVVVNRPGAGGALAADFVARQKPDGYTLLVAGGSESVSIPHHRKLRYKLSDFEGVIRCMRSRNLLVVRSDSEITTLPALLEKARNEPGGLLYGSSGYGTLYHSTMLVFEEATGTELRHIPFRGGGQMMAALLGGHIDLLVSGPEDVRSQMAAGTIALPAVSSTERSHIHPDVPTLEEFGINVFIENQKGIVAPKGLPPDVYTYLHDHFKKGMESDAWIEMTERLSMESGYLDGPAFMNAMIAMSNVIEQSLKGENPK